MSLENLAEKVYPVFMKNFHDDSDCKLFLSASDMKTRAIVRHAHANSPEEAWKFALEELKKVLQSEKIKPKIFRADWVVSSEKITWKNFIDLLRKTRRNYFRKGLALDEDYKISFTEQELNGNSMLYKDGKEGSPQCVFRKDRSDKYCQTRFGCDFPELDENKIVEIFETDGAFVEEDEEPKLITGRGIYSGHRDVSHRDPKIFMDCAKNGANYLARQVQKNGKFIYGVWSCFDKKIPSYNTIRHFSSISSMLDVYRVYKKMPPIKLGKAIISATEYGVKNLIVQRKLEDGTEAAYPVDKDTKEIRLGALGIALLTLSNYTELMHTKKYVPLMNLIARGIMSMQNEDGSFVHVLNSDDFSLKESFRIVYYDGEAVLGLLKLYAITQDEKLLQTAEKAFTRFVETNHWKNHDHWLSYAVNELTRYKPEKKYFEFGINNFLTFLPFIYHRDTQFPTLLELMAAADIMLERMKTMPEMSDLLEKVNFDDFYSAMENRAKNTLNGYFWAELAMYFANPERIVEGFFIRHHAFRVRIDDVQHFLSGFVLYSNYLERRKDFPAPVPSQALLEGRAEGTGVFNIQSTSQTETSDSSSDANLNISETNKIISDEKIDPIPSTPPLISDKNETLPPLRVGILRKNRGFFHPQNTLYAMFYTAKHFNIELALFSPQKINFSDKSIQADFLENGKWITKKISFPKIVDNSILYGSDGEILKNLEKYSYLVRHSLNTTKQKVYDLLLQDGKYEEFLIKSHTVNSYEEFCNLFSTYHEDIILKPLRGARGIGVAHIFKDNETGSLVVNAENNNYYLTWEDFAKFYREHFVHRKHILQPYIKSRTHAGNPFDIRIHCRRGAEGKFKVSPFPRIGNAKGVVSNIASGGFSMKFNTFLQVEFGDDWKKIYDKLMDFGRTFPDYYQSFYATTIFDIGVDMGIQKHGDTYEFKIFEVNTYIDGPFFEIEDAITHFEYYRYLSEKLGINSSQDSSKKNSDNPIPPQRIRFT